MGTGMALLLLQDMAQKKIKSRNVLFSLKNILWKFQLSLLCLIVISTNIVKNNSQSQSCCLKSSLRLRNPSLLASNCSSNFITLLGLTNKCPGVILHDSLLVLQKL